MLDYTEGRSALTFDTARFDFRTLMLRHLQGYADARGGADFERLEEVHRAPGIRENLEPYRQACFALFRTEPFQALFKPFGAWLIDTFFGGTGLIQKTPTVRIQLPGATSTSYHSDGWYGHGASVRSFWLPLTEVGPGNSLHMARDVGESRAVIAEILARKANLAEINEIAGKVCAPFTGDFGSLLTFSSEMIHGAERNETERSRVSFDFRIAPDPADLGTKPRSNFYSRVELDGAEAGAAGVAVRPLSGITYSNLCKGKSAKAQLMLCSAYAEANGIRVTGNEAEIVALDYMPVMRNYLLEGAAEATCVVCFGLDIFDGDRALAAEIFDCADRGGRTLIFCAEGLHYEPGAAREPLLARV